MFDRLTLVEDLTMAWHIKLGKLSWCELPFARRTDLALAARDDGIVLRCSHLHRRQAERMVAFLQEYGVDFVRVVEGICDVDEASFESATKPP